MKGKKAIHWGGGLGGTIQIAPWKCNFGIYLDIQIYYLDIQAITTFLCLILVLYVLVPSIYSIFYLITALLKSEVFRHSKAYSSQLSTYRYWTGFIVKRKQVHIPIILAYLKIYFFLVAYFAPKKYALFKNFPIFFCFFFQKEIIGHTYICTKCNNYFKFTISLKS